MEVNEVQDLCLMNKTNNNKEILVEKNATENGICEPEEIERETRSKPPHSPKLSDESEGEPEKEISPVFEKKQSPLSPKNPLQNEEATPAQKTPPISDTRAVLREKKGSDSVGSRNPRDEKNDENVPMDAELAELNNVRAAMFKVYQPWVIKTYGDFTKTKTVSLKKYDRIVRTLLGLIPNCAENSKFRFWIRSKGFRLGLPPSIAPDSDPNQLYVLGRKSGSEGRSYRKVAIVEQFFEIIYQVHVESGGKHAGQKKTYRTITQTYAFLPREAVTKFLLGCAECQKRLDLDTLNSDIFKVSKKETPIKSGLKRKYNTWDANPTPCLFDPSCHPTNLSVPWDLNKRNFLKLPKYSKIHSKPEEEETSQEGYKKYRLNQNYIDVYHLGKDTVGSDEPKPTKCLKYESSPLRGSADVENECERDQEPKPQSKAQTPIKEETEDPGTVLDLKYKPVIKSVLGDRDEEKSLEIVPLKKDENDHSESPENYPGEVCPLNSKSESRDPLYKIKSEFYLRHQTDHRNVKRQHGLLVNVPNVLRPVPILSLKSDSNSKYDLSDVRIKPKFIDHLKETGSEKGLMSQLYGPCRRKKSFLKRYTSTPEPLRHQKMRYVSNYSSQLSAPYSSTSTSTNDTDSIETSYSAEILDLSPINSQNKISKFKLPQSVAPVSYIQIPVWNPELFRYKSESPNPLETRNSRDTRDPSEYFGRERLSAHPGEEDSDSEQPQGRTYMRRMKELGYFDEAIKFKEENMMSTEMETVEDDHFSSRNGELRLSDDLPGEEIGGGSIWPNYPIGMKKSTSTPPGSRDLSSPVILQETGSVHDETSSSGNKEDEDEDEEDVDDLKTLHHDPERLKAFNMFVRLFVDENLDRIVPISKQPKEKIQAIIDSCTRQFPEFAERARKRIRTYLKSCRRNKRARDPGNWPEANRPTPAHLTSVQAEQILAQACENESHNAKRMRLGLEPVSQPMPVLPGQSEQPRPIDHFSSSTLTTTTSSSLNNNISSRSSTSISQSDTTSTETNKESAGGSGKTVLQQHLINNNNNLANNNNNIKDVLNFTKGLTATSLNSDHSTSKTSNSRSSLSSNSALNGSPVVTRMEASPLYRHNPAFSQAFTPRGVSSQTSIYAGPSPNMFSTSPFGHAAMMGNGPTDLSMKQTSKPLLNHKLNPTEMAAVRQLITGYRESAAFLLRSADELEQLLLQQP